MTDLYKLVGIIDRLLAINCPFALWSMPGSNTPKFLSPKTMNWFTRPSLINSTGRKGLFSLLMKFQKNRRWCYFAPEFIKKG